MSKTIPDLIAILTKASHAYYNGLDSIMDDSDFDRMLEQLRKLDPEAPFLKTVGAPCLSTGHIALPYTMPSLEKIKPGQDSLQRFVARAPAYVLSEKLDGLSAMWSSNTGALYLRGDGRVGTQITQFAKHIQGLIYTPSPCVVRGELIIPRGTTSGVGLRAIVNGLLHQKTVDPEKVSQIHFVAYEVISPAGLTRKDQFEWLTTNGFEVPWWSCATILTEEACSNHFQERRVASLYETDGIVVGIDQACARDTTSTSAPKDCMAFKMVVADQSAITTVRAVLWAVSAQGYLIPRLQFDPIQINGATIEFCTGHNARIIMEQRLGPGAMIRIRRSGDVIPTLDTVLLPATPSLPEDTDSWAWTDGPNPTHICATMKTTEQTTSQLLHFAKTLEIPGLGPANCKALVEKGINSPATLWQASEQTLCSLLGPTSGKTLHQTLRKVLVAPPLSELKLLLASSKLPRGIGEAKLKSLIQTYYNPTSWADIATPPSGWTTTTFQEFQQSLVGYEAWRRQETFWIPYPIVGATTEATATTVSPTKGRICFTGFRNKDLEERAKLRGYEIVSGVTANLTMLITATEDSVSEKVKKAKAMLTVEVLSWSEFTVKYMS